jgi:hypothetical protein
MQGLPKILQTREDFDLALELARAGEVVASNVARDFEGLIGSAHHFVFDRELSVSETADGIMPDFCVTEATEQDPLRRQLKLSVDADARLFALGYTLAEAQSIISELESK